jgi:hypothetical protein
LAFFRKPIKRIDRKARDAAGGSPLVLASSIARLALRTWCIGFSKGNILINSWRGGGRKN